MNLTDLPTSSDWDAWECVLSDTPDSYYEGATAVGIFGATVEDITTDRIARVDLWHAAGLLDYGEQDFVCLVELTDGTWATCVAWCDTTGWGCRRQGVEWKVATTRDDAIRLGLDKAARARLGVPLPGEADEDGAR
jgi:hypothetical protein